MAWNPKGTLLATCGGDHVVKIWSRQNLANKSEWSCIASLSEGHTRTIRWVSWSPCGNKLGMHCLYCYNPMFIIPYTSFFVFFWICKATASFDTTIVVWKRKSDSDYEIVANLEGHENEVKCTAWSNDGSFLASCSRDRSVWVWDGNFFYRSIHFNTTTFCYLKYYQQKCYIFRNL